MTEPSTFLTLEYLHTLAGQVFAVGAVTQAARAAVPGLSTYVVRLIAVAAGVGLHAVLVWTSGQPTSAYALALINGALVALTAMKAVELVKGKG